MSASSSSSLLSPRQWKYDVFPSFSGQDVRRNFLSHLLGEFKRKGINTFVDDQIRRSESINSELIRAIRESRIAVVILSKNYASSSWCLDELQLIMECHVSLEQTVMTIFYEVEPSDVRKQTGDFGKAFEKTCHGKTEVEKQRWRQALNQVAAIAGEHSVSWPNEALMISKIIMDVSNELPSSDFDRLVGIETHVEKMKSIIRLESEEVKIVGIWGPAGIGKTTIARALHQQVSCNFQLKFFMESDAREYNTSDSIFLQNHLEKKIQSGVLDHRGMKIPDAQFRLKHQRVLLILDDVCSEELQALGNLIQGLRFGSKVIVTNEDLDTLRKNGINHIYKVSFPSTEEAQQILSYSAFGQSSPPRGYLKHAVEVATLIAPFPLALKVLGSALRGKSKEEWTMTPAKLKTDRDDNDIDKAIRYVYDGLSEKHKTLFSSLADSKHLAMNDAIVSLAGRDWDVDVEEGIQTLADLSLISISGEGEIIVHPRVKNHVKEMYFQQQMILSTNDFQQEITEETATKPEGEKKPVDAKKGDGGITVVMKLDMHCEGCGKKIKRLLKHYKGVEDVKIDYRANKLTVIGNVDPAAVRDKVADRIKRNVQLVSTVAPLLEQ